MYIKQFQERIKRISTVKRTFFWDIGDISLQFLAVFSSRYS